MLRRERERGSRREVYVVDDDAWHGLMMRRDHLYAPILRALQGAVDDRGTDAPAYRRLMLTAEFLRFVDAEMVAMTDRWAAHRGSSSAGCDALGSGAWPLLDSTARHLRRTALAKQRDGRLPGLYAGVCRGGELVWGDGIGVVEVGADRRRRPTTSSWSRPTPRRSPP